MMDKILIHNNNESFGSRYSTIFDSIMHDFMIQKFANLFENKKCLEMGCYHGEMTKKIAKIANFVTSIDNDDESIDKSIQNCASNNNIQIIKSDFIDFEKYNEYDTIFSSHSFEHVEDDLALMKNLFNKISLNSKLIVVVPNGYSLSRQIAVKMNLMKSELCVTEFEKKIGHYRTYSKDKLISLAISAGFNILEDGGIFPKFMSNLQLDAALNNKIIDQNYLISLNQLSSKYPDICSSIFIVVNKK